MAVSSPKSSKIRSWRPTCITDSVSATRLSCSLDKATEGDRLSGFYSVGSAHGRLFFDDQSGPQKKRCVRSNPLAPDTNEFCDSAPSLTAVAQAPPRYGPLQVPIYLVGAHDGSAGARAVGYSIRAPNSRRTGASAAPVEASAEKSEFGT
jgi:hypothetical protein